jgi:hypothetical protein
MYVTYFQNVFLYEYEYIYSDRKKTEKISTRIKGVLVDLGDRGLGAFFGVTTIVYICSNEMNGYHMLIIGLFLSTWRGTSGR